jgi:hypothetical protein
MRLGRSRRSERALACGNAQLRTCRAINASSSCLKTLQAAGAR